MFYVYILYSQTIDSFYKGQTSDLQDRLKRHNSGHEFATKSGAPWRLIWQTTKATRSESMVLEHKLKNLGRKRTIHFILKYSTGIPGPDEALLIKRLSEC